MNVKTRLTALQICLILVGVTILFLLMFKGRHFFSANLLPVIRYFDRSVRYSLRDIKDSMSVWKLLTFWFISFLYGIVHALGPGHGKAIVTAYFLSHKHKQMSAMPLAAVISLTHILGAVLLSILFATLIKNAGPFLKIRMQGYFIAASGLVILAAGLVLLLRKIFFEDREDENGAETLYDNPLILGIIAGIVPCPVTVFIVTFSMAQGIPLVGLAAASALSMGMFLLLFAVGVLTARGREGVVLYAERKYLHGIVKAAESLEYISLFLIIFIGAGMAASLFS